ncbi:hypothetical protein DFP72DRAFT_1172544 [Ephemerocybe angulata]|uniref:F-box domain-containing protein n=1 Tax=Ephemerocybe angulata TaxID=980116 RepID=A0A8H6HQ77_9AGAR|nr:hypothetical protein DFP72DRAFT_1172544 [Tulosesus angulatus]
MPPMATLTALPLELLSLILQELGLEDFLRTRAVCKPMYVAGRSRHVWSSFLRTNLGTTLPHPFFLPKPIQECSHVELESSIRRWDADWALKMPLQVNNLPVVKEGPTRDPLLCTSFCMVPGGQFVLAGLADGSVWTFDLSGGLVSTPDVRASLLVPPPATLPETAGAVQVRLAMDYISDEALGETARETYHLSQFNLATIACPTEDELSSSHVNVWRIHLSPIATSDGIFAGHEIRLGDHLCSYMESTTDYLCGLSLFGNTIAYSMQSPPTDCTVIVNWQDADAKKEDDELLRWYIPDTPIMTIHLLPGDRIFVENNRVVAILNWRVCCPTSTLPPSRQDLQYIPYPWSRTLMSPVSGFAISSPVIMGDAIRLVVPTSKAVYSLTIPIDDHDLKAVQFQELMVTSFSADRGAQSFGSRRAVGIDHTLDGIYIFTAQYRFKEDISKKGYRPSCRRHPYPFGGAKGSFPGYLLFDQFSNRIVQTDKHASYFITLSSHASHSLNSKETTETDTMERGETGRVEGVAIAGHEGEEDEDEEDEETSEEDEDEDVTSEEETDEDEDETSEEETDEDEYETCEEGEDETGEVDEDETGVVEEDETGVVEEGNPGEREEGEGTSDDDDDDGPGRVEENTDGEFRDEDEDEANEGQELGDEGEVSSGGESNGGAKEDREEEEEGEEDVKENHSEERGLGVPELPSI